MTTCTQVAVGSLFVLTLTACGGGGGGSSEPAQASADPDSTIEWQGDWQVDTNYALNDIVYFQGQAFINVLPTTGSENPQDASHWELLVDRGETGPRGLQGVAGTEGAVGPTGLTGPQGVAGATGPTGPASLVWQGAYTGGNSYQINDAVSFNGSAYISIQDTTGTEDPSDTSYWELLAEKGAEGRAGPQGPTGVAGNDGVAGPQGVAGADGVIGPAGPAGPQGVAGADGAAGPTGPTGPQGVAGADGAAGPTGPTGPQGIAGADGAAGSTGPAGPQGAVGATGPAGPASLLWQGAYTGGNSYQINDAVSFNGSAYISIQDTTGTEDPSDTSYWELLAEKGADGSVGPQGPIGAPGNDGAAGSQGIAGADGTAGPTGPAGAQGVAGADGTTGPAGPTGPQGVAGADGATGPTGPASLVWQGAYTGGNSYQINDAVSFNGSAYISIQNTTGAEDPNNSAYWEFLAAKGADGLTGAQGPVGNDGEVGPQGSQGFTGDTGPQGPQGLAGTDGPTGSQGPQGPSGTDGATGPQGIAGAEGATGPQGPAGADGMNLPDGVDSGDLLYWDGTMWNLTPAPPVNPTGPMVLTLDSGIPTWEMAGLSITTYSIGDTGPAGGIVFYVTDDGLHGLEAAPVDQESSQWGCANELTEGADGSEIGTGLLNTLEIIQDCGMSTAAGVAYSYELNGYFDWYLPSRDELNLMYESIGANGYSNEPIGDGGFASNVFYWASTEHSRTDINWAYARWMNRINEQAYYKNNTYYVRSTRTF